MILVLFSNVSYCNLIICFDWSHQVALMRSDITVKILKFGTPQTIAIIVLKIEKFDGTLH